MKYAVAYLNLNYYDNNLQITTVEANDPITAMIEGVRKLLDAPDPRDEWLNSMLENIPAPDGYAARIKEIQQEFYNTDQAIAVMPIEEIIEMATPEEFDKAPVVTVECPLCGAISNHNKWPRKKLVVICGACNYEWVAVDADGRIYKPKLK